jgi:hypothetical protein
MNPFLEIPITATDSRVTSSDKLFKSPKVETVTKEVTLRARPGEIESYHSAPFDNGILIVMKSGKEHHSSWTFDQMDVALHEYNGMINAKESRGKFGNVVVNHSARKLQVEKAVKE